jgi:hypothetical protein
MSMSYRDMQALPTLPVGFTDLAALRSVIVGYLAYARRSISPSWQRDGRMRLLGGLYQRLANISPGSAEIHILLSESEIRALNEAIAVFDAFVREKISPSQERDETLYSLEQLRQMLLRMGTFASQD